MRLSCHFVAHLVVLDVFTPLYGEFAAYVVIFEGLSSCFESFCSCFVSVCVHFMSQFSC